MSEKNEEKSMRYILSFLLMSNVLISCGGSSGGSSGSGSSSSSGAEAGGVFYSCVTPGLLICDQYSSKVKTRENVLKDCEGGNDELPVAEQREFTDGTCPETLASNSRTGRCEVSTSSLGLIGATHYYENDASRLAHSKSVCEEGGVGGVWIDN